MNETKLKLINYVLLSVSIFATLGLMTYASGGIAIGPSLFTLWTILPFLILLLITYRTSSRKTLIVTTILSVLCALSTCLYFDSLFVRLDAQDALTFLFLPLYQLFAIIVGFTILAVVKFFSDRK